MTEYIAQILIALIGAIPPTIMATAALIKTKKLTKPIEEVNRAVNHRNPNQKRLIELVDDVSTNLEIINDNLENVKNEIQSHKAWHQNENEQNENIQNQNE